MNVPVKPGHIRLQNRRRRIFTADLVYSPGERRDAEEQNVSKVRTIRLDLHEKTGKKVIREHFFPIYQNLTILAEQTSEWLPETYLEVVGIKAAIESGWLRVLR